MPGSPALNTTTTYSSPAFDTGWSTSSTTTTLSDASKDWPTNLWVGYLLVILSPEAQSIRVITGNTGTQLTVAAWSKVTAPQRVLYRIVGPNFIFDISGIDNAAIANQELVVASKNRMWNGVGWDRVRNNINLYSVADVTTATFTGADIKTYNAKSLLVLIDVTTFTDTSYTPEVQWKDGAANYRSLWQQKTVKTGAAGTIVLIGPGVSTGATSGIIDGATVGDSSFGTTDSATLNQLVEIPFPVPNIIRVVVTKVHAAGAFTGNFQVQAS